MNYLGMVNIVGQPRGRPPQRRPSFLEKLLAFLRQPAPMPPAAPATADEVQAMIQPAPRTFREVMALRPQTAPLTSLEAQTLIPTSPRNPAATRALLIAHSGI